MPSQYRHPAHGIEPAHLLDQLAENVRNGTVYERREGPLSLFHYTNQCQFDVRWNEWNWLARGLVIDRENLKIVATPFPKFFNYGERGQFQLPAEPFEAFEKLDGSFGICFFHAGRWRVTTKGAFDQTQARWAEQQFRYLNQDALEPGHTYLFEIIYQGNQIVVRYRYEGLVLLGGFDTDGYELTRAELEATAANLGCRLAARFSFANLDEILRAADELDGTSEGFVIRFQSGLRIKIKGAVYRRIHRMVTRVTPLGLWAALEAGDDLDALRREIPEEFWTDFDEIRAVLEGKLQALLTQVEICFEQFAGYSDKEIGLQLLALPTVARIFLFPRRRFGPTWLEHERIRRRVFGEIRPDQNQLDGYSPSETLKRVSSEEP